MDIRTPAWDILPRVMLQLAMQTGEECVGVANHSQTWLLIV